MRKSFNFFMIFTFMIPFFLFSASVTYGADASTIIQVGAGDFYTVLLKSDGSLWSYVENDSGTFSLQKYMDEVQFISIGSVHGMAIKKDGTLWGWGDNSRGQLGDGSYETADDPVKVLDQVATVSAGHISTLAIKTDGSLWGWGDNRSGQISSSEEEDIIIPTKMMDNVQAAVSGNNCNYILKKDNTLWAQGISPYTVAPVNAIPSQTIQIGADIQDIFVDMETDNLIYLKEDGSLWTWDVGYKNQNSLVSDLTKAITGKGNYFTTLTPKKISEKVATASYRNNQLGILKKDGTLWLFDNYDMFSTPERFMENVDFFTIGLEFGVAVKTDGTLWGWGDNQYAQLGIANPNIHTTPQELTSGTDISQIFTGDGHYYFLKEDHTLWTFPYSEKPNRGPFVKILDHVQEVQLQMHLAVVLTEDQTLLLIKEDNLGEMDWDHPFPVMEQVVAMDIYFNYLSVVMADGSLWIYDLFSHTDGEEIYPVKITDNVKDAAMEANLDATGSGVYVLKKDHSLWFYSFSGYKFDPDQIPPSKIITTDVKTFTNAFHFAAFIKTDGSLWTWGKNNFGVLGNGTMESVTKPTKIMDNVASVQSANFCGMAVKTDGSLWAWGNNSTGQLGIGTTKNQLQPVKVMDHVKTVGLGYGMTFVLKKDGSLWGFGYDDTGFYLGEKIDTYYSDPVQMKVQ